MLLFHWMLTALLVIIFFYDLIRYIIPNWTVGTLLVLWPVMLLISPTFPEGFVFWHSLLVFGAVFLVGFWLFSKRVTGGGDVKLLAVLSLWTGTQSTVELITFMALLGGGMAMLCLLTRPVAAKFIPAEKAASVPRILRYKEPIPYGIAITLAFGYLLWKGLIPGLPL